MNTSTYPPKKLFTLAMSILFFNAFAQSPLRVKVEAGYGLGLPSSSIVVEKDQYFFRSSKFQELQTAGGLQLGVSIGTELTNGIRLSANFNYQRTANQVFKDYLVFFPRNNPYNSVPYENTSQVNYQTLSLSPQITFILNDTKSNLKPFVSIGPSLILRGKNEISATYYLEMQNQVISSTTIHNFSISFGAMASLGLERQINQNFSLQVSARFRFAYLEPNNYQLTKYLINGEDKLHTLSSSEREGIYANELLPDNGSGQSQRYHPEISWMGADVMLGLIYKL